MAELDFVIAECPRCGLWCFAESEEKATEQYYNHCCLRDMTNEELDKMLDRIINIPVEERLYLEGLTEFRILESA